MYPVDVPSLIQRETIGSRASDPTLPHRRSRLARLRQALARSEAAGRPRRVPAPGRA